MPIKIQTPNSEIREDFIHDRFVIIAPKRSQRPHDVIEHKEIPVKSKDCPFCQEVKFMSQPPLYQIGPDKSWEIKVIRNIFPVVSPRNPKVYGHHEIVIETPHHNKELADFSEGHIIRLFETYAARIKALQRDKKIVYILIFKNHGGKAGASLVHAHSQIFATGVIPPHVVDKLTRAENYRIKFGICYYCELIGKEIRGPRKIYSDKYVAAFAPYASTYNYEAWILPKRHVDDLNQFTDDEMGSLAKAIKLVVTKINKLNLPYNYYVHQTLTDKSEHFYLRICPRKDVWAGIELGSRLIVNTVAPEAAAKFYRE